MKRHVGLHIRMRETPLDVIQKAVHLGMPTFQFFLRNEKKRYPYIQNQWLKEFLTLRRAHFSKIYVHGSYWINLCLPKPLGLPVLERELMLAKRFECTHLVLHPGSVDPSDTCADSRERAIGNLVSMINRVMKHERDITLVLENTAHGNLSVGSNIDDFKFILDGLDHPEKIRYCVDTAHAFAYGYDISYDFVKQIDHLIGAQYIDLLHVNDTHEQRGSCIDHHALIGEGVIGLTPLTEFVQDELLRHTSVIAELPVVSIVREYETLDMLQRWALMGDYTLYRDNPSPYEINNRI